MPYSQSFVDTLEARIDAQAAMLKECREERERLHAALFTANAAFVMATETDDPETLAAAHRIMSKAMEVIIE